MEITRSNIGDCLYLHDPYDIELDNCYNLDQFVTEFRCEEYDKRRDIYSSFRIGPKPDIALVFTAEGVKGNYWLTLWEGESVSNIYKDKQTAEKAALQSIQQRVEELIKSVNSLAETIQ
jgi:hypothetical protein